MRALPDDGSRHEVVHGELLVTPSLRQDRFTKRRLYQEVGIPLYWVVDADARSVEVWTPEAVFPRVETDALASRPAGAAESLTIPLEPLFRPL